MVTLVNRAKVSTATTGTGTITLGTAESGYQSFADAGVADADVVRYVIEDGTDWEIGTGTYTATGTTLSRTVSESSNADAAIVLTGSATVFIGATAEDIPPALDLFAESYDGTSTLPSATGTNSVAVGKANTASGTNSSVLGANSTASNSGAVALGNSAIASGNSAFSFGDSTASGGNSIAMGSDAVASATDTIAIGKGATAAATYSTAIGKNSGDSGSVTATGNAAMALGGSYASGTDSFAAAIASNSSSYGATGANSIAMGYQCKSTGPNGVSLGQNNIVSGDNATAIGYFNTASGYYTTALGYDNTTSSAFGHAIGFQAVSSVKGKGAYASGAFSADGDAQTGLITLRSDTTDATAEAMTADNLAAGTVNQIILPNNSAFSFSGTIIARQQAADGSNYASWEIKGALLRDANAASTVLGNGIVNKLFATAGASAWAIALTADTTNGGLKIEATGAAATDIRWVATVNTSEVTYA
jgi:trimeric autotransporter adhesin